MTKKQQRKYPRVQTPVSGESRTKQQFAKECDINHLMAKYERSGALDHLNNREPEYGYATGDTFQESMELIATGQSMFEELPATLRKKFHHNPNEFLDFVQDENNLEEMRSIGLAHPQGQEPATEESNETQKSSNSSESEAKTEGNNA